MPHQNGNNQRYTIPESVTIIRDGVEHVVPNVQSESILESARRVGLQLPFSCQIGSCATCLAKVVEGEVLMRANNVLTDDELEEGLILVCQGIPVGEKVTISYD